MPVTGLEADVIHASVPLIRSLGADGGVRAFVPARAGTGHGFILCDAFNGQGDRIAVRVGDFVNVDRVELAVSFPEQRQAGYGRSTVGWIVREL